jgi:hypothetical protein
MRAIFTFLLCLCVATQGYVAAHAFQMPCPMDKADIKSFSVDEIAVAVVDCCNDAETAAKTGKLCKTDAPCGSSSAFVFPSLQSHLPTTQASELVPVLDAMTASFDLKGVWRPPSLS